jgi:hypothetical protein
MNMNECLPAAETSMRLALKAKSQCRSAKALAACAIRAPTVPESLYSVRAVDGRLAPGFERFTK